MVKFDHMNLPVTDYKRSRDWYTENFGFKVEFEVPERQTVSLQDYEGMGIFLYESKIALAGAKCSLYFQIDSVDTKFKELQAKGVPFINPPGNYFWGYGAELRDPDDYQILLWDRRSMAEKGKTG
ncbi:MAG: VOC family protein [Capsulimonadaceae bacterium]